MSGEYTLYKNWITRLLEDKFGAGYKHTENGGQLTFSLDKLQKISKSYQLDIDIKTRLKSDTDTTDTTDTILKEAPASESRESLENSQDTDKDNINIIQNEGLEGNQASFRMPSVSSEPSVPSAMTEEEKAQDRAKYNASRANIRKGGFGR